MITRVLALVFATVIVAGTQSQPPTPSGTNSGQEKQQQAAQEKPDAGISQQARPQATSPRAGVQQSPEPPETAKPDGNTDNKNAEASLDWWLKVTSSLSNVVIALVTIALAIVAIVQAYYMRDALAETRKAATAAVNSAAAQTSQLRLLYAPCIELINCRTDIDEQVSPEEDGPAFLHIRWDIFNAGAAPIQFVGVTASAQAHGGDRWSASPELRRTLGKGRTVEFLVAVHELTHEHGRLYRENRLIVRVQLLVTIHDPIDNEDSPYTYRRRVTCGATREPIVDVITDGVDPWPESKGMFR